MEIVSGEDFEVTEAIHTEVHERAEQIQKHLKNEALIRFHLSQTAPSQFQVKIEVKYSDKFVVGHAEERDFHKSLNEAKAKVMRQIDDLHGRAKANRH